MVKRIFDISFSFFILLLLCPILLLCWIVISLNTFSLGIFSQIRIGRHAKLFKIYKFRTINLTSAKISKVGAFFRKTKLDEFPQLFNILKGEMSVVGPRPDIAGYYDQLQGENRKILELKPGLTSIAALKYVNEEALLATVKNPQLYNDEVIFPDKVKLNLEYYYTRTFWGDLKIVWKTFIRLFK